MKNEHIKELLKEQNIDMEPNPRLRQFPVLWPVRDRSVNNISMNIEYCKSTALKIRQLTFSPHLMIRKLTRISHT